MNDLVKKLRSGNDRYDYDGMYSQTAAESEIEQAADSIEHLWQSCEAKDKRIKELEHWNAEMVEKAASTEPTLEAYREQQKRIEELQQGEKHYSDLWEQAVEANMKHQKTIKAMSAEINRLKGERDEL